MVRKSTFVNRLVLLLAVFFITTGGLLAAAQSDQDLVKSVADRLLPQMKPLQGTVWPPKFDIEPSDEVNASSTIEESADKQVPVVRVTQGILTKVVQSDQDMLSFIVGHELAHLELKHVRLASDDRTPFVKAAFSRKQELDADVRGMEMALAAGYSYQRGLKSMQRIMEVCPDYSSFEGLGVDHPSWKDRLAELDKNRESLWRAMSAFDNGNFFLLSEQYLSAEKCFRKVVADFPTCHEGWANLGYALLMQYCDSLELDDLRSFDIAQIVCGGFYRRPESLESQVRGIDEDLWWDAVKALKEALRLKPDLVLAKANLGIAYLVSPSGKDIDNATKFLQEAADQVKDDQSLDALARSSVLVNAGIVDIIGGRVTDGQRRLGEGEELARNFIGPRPESSDTLTISDAILYNRALALATSPQKEEHSKAIRMFEDYLGRASKASSWWKLAYERYTSLCTEAGETARKESSFASRQESLRPVTSIKFGDKGLVSLSEGLSAVRARIGDGESTPAASGTNIACVRYPSLGFELLGTDQVLAIRLRDTASPPVLLSESGLGAKQESLKVGMTRDELEAVLADQDYDFRQIDDPEVDYRFYRKVGLAVLVKKGIVQELVIVQIPERAGPMGI